MPDVSPTPAGFEEEGGADRVEAPPLPTSIVVKEPSGRPARLADETQDPAGFEEEALGTPAPKAPVTPPAKPGAKWFDPSANAAVIGDAAHSAYNKVRPTLIHIREGVQSALRPAATAVADAVASVAPQPSEKPPGLMEYPPNPATQLLMRSFMSTLGGNEMVSSLPPEVQQKAMQKLTTVWGPKGAGRVVQAADMAGGLIPLMFAPELVPHTAVELKGLEWTAKGGPVLGALAKMATAATRTGITNAALNSLTAASHEGADIPQAAAEGFTTGAILGGSVSFLGQGLGWTANKLFSKVERARIASAPPPAPADAQYNNASVLLHLDETGGSSAETIAKEFGVPEAQARIDLAHAEHAGIVTSEDGIYRLTRAGESAEKTGKIPATTGKTTYLGEVTPEGNVALVQELSDASNKGALEKTPARGTPRPPNQISTEFDAKGGPVIRPYTLFVGKDGLQVHQHPDINVNDFRALAKLKGTIVNGGFDSEWLRKVMAGRSPSQTQSIFEIFSREGRVPGSPRFGLNSDSLGPPSASGAHAMALPNGEIAFEPTGAHQVSEEPTGPVRANQNLTKLDPEVQRPSPRNAAQDYNTNPLLPSDQPTQPGTPADLARAGVTPGGGAGPDAVPQDTTQPGVGGAPPPPSPPRPPPPETLPQHVQQDLAVMRNGSKIKGFWDTVSSMVSGRGFSGVESVREHAQGLIAAKDLKANEDVYLKALYHAAPELKTDMKLNADLVKYAEGTFDAHDIERDHPAAWGKLNSLFEDFLQQRDVRHAELAESGRIPPEYADMADSDARKKYVAMMYLRRLAPKEFAKIVPDQMLLDAQSAVVSKWGKTPAQARDVIAGMMGADDPIAGLKAGNDQAFAHLRSIRDLPDAVRKVLGPAGHVIRIARTLAVQDSLVQIKRVMDSIKLDPNAFSATERRPGFVPVPNEPTVYGDLAGGYWSQELDEVMKNVRDMPQHVGKAAQFMSGLAKLRKANLVLGTGTLLKHIVGLGDSSALAGGLYDSSPVEAGQYMAKAVKALRSYRLNPTESNLDADPVWAAKRSRGLEQSWTSVETRDSATRKTLDAFEKSVADPEQTKDKWDIFQHAQTLMSGAKKVGGLPTAAARALFDTLNDTVRLANHMALVDKFVAQEMTPEAAAIKAGQRVAISFPSGTNVGKLTNDIRSSPLSSLALSFATPIMEKARIYSRIPMRLQNEPDMAARLLVHEMIKVGIFGSALYSGASATKAITGGWMGAMRQMNGISNEENDAMRAKMSRSSYEFHPSMQASFLRDGHGEPIFIDPSPGSFVLESLRGNPMDAWWKRAAVNLTTEPMGEEATKAAMGLAQQTGFMRGDGGGPQRPIPGDEVRSIAMSILHAGAIPQQLVKTIEAVRSMTPSSPYQRAPTPGFAAAKSLLPLVGPAQNAKASKEDMSEFRQMLKGQIHAVVTNQKLAPEEKATRIAKILEQIHAPSGPLDRLQTRSVTQEAWEKSK